MLLTKTVKIKWADKNKNYYKNKGYIFTDRNTEFEIKVEHLQNGSHVFVNVKCDCEDCKNPYLKPMTWKNFLRCVKEDGKYYCQKCATNLFARENINKSKLKNSKSFEQWCYDNLTKQESDEILSRWDYELNIDKEGNPIKPNEVCYRSKGFNNKGYWFKCLKHKEHKSELKHISRFCSKSIGSLFCNQCNSFGQYLLDTHGKNGIKDYWSNENLLDPFKIGRGSKNIKVFIKCVKFNYHYDYPINPSNFISGNRCPCCSSKKIHPLDSLGKLLEDKKLLHLWSKENKKLPYEYAKNASSQEVWWKCPNNEHKDYKRKISESNRRDFRCPSCQFSKGEKRIEEYLMSNKIEYIAQHEYDDLIGLGGGNLSYDFYLPQFNLLVEYQGEQHERYIKGLHKSKKDFDRQVEHDKRKQIYSEDNKINLLPIWYWDFDNIEGILDKELTKIKSKELRECI